MKLKIFDEKKFGSDDIFKLYGFQLWSGLFMGLFFASTSLWYWWIALIVFGVLFVWFGSEMCKKIKKLHQEYLRLIIEKRTGQPCNIDFSGQ